MTTTAPNLGKLHTSSTTRPATAEDIEILVPGDWISEKECPWSYHFKRWDGDMCIGAWEGKEFPIPRQLVMVCEVIEGKATKFYRKPENSLLERRLNSLKKLKNGCRYWEPKLSQKAQERLPILGF